MKRVFEFNKFLKILWKRNNKKDWIKILRALLTRENKVKIQIKLFNLKYSLNLFK